LSGSFREQLERAVAILAIALAPHEAVAATSIRADGSSTVFPLMNAIAEEFSAREAGHVVVKVAVSGTTGGFRKFCKGDTEISDASRPILTEEIDACRVAGVAFFEIPIAFDALTVAVSPKATWIDSIGVDELKRIWEPEAEKRVTRWNQIRPEWPDQPLVLFGPGHDSGTFDYFTDTIVGKPKAIRSDYTGSEDYSVIVQGIESNGSSLGYLPYAYYAQNAAHLKALAISSAAGKPGVTPSLENVKNGMYQPLSRPLFVYVSATAAKRAEVQRFVEYLLSDGGHLAEVVKYLPLSDATYHASRARFRAGKTGSVFEGVPAIGVSLDEMLRRERAH